MAVEAEHKIYVEVEHQTYADVDVGLDGNKYSDCTFTRCRFLYSGQTPIFLADCLIIDCEWEFAGAAGRTLKVLGSMYSIDPELVERTLDTHVRSKHAKKAIFH